MKSYEIFQKMSPTMAVEILSYVQKEQAPVFKSVVQTLASQRNLRSVFVERKPPAERYAWIKTTLGRKPSDILAAHLLQAWLVAAAGTYFVFFWTRGGQTLPMKTWRIRLVRAEGGGPVHAGRALHRYALALLGTLAVGLGFAWALVDRDRQFLHDRLAGTALVSA